MDAATLAGLCSILLRNAADQATMGAVGCPPPAAISAPAFDPSRLRGLVDAGDARDGISRVTYAEAGNQGDSGLAAVVYTILNRLQDGRWGRSVDAVLDARRQFEPVMRAGGTWRALPPVSAAARARIDTILNLALDGRLPDLTGGARFFQNPTIVAARARAGSVSPGMVDFGGAAPSAVIGAHRFYVAARPGSAGRRGSSGSATIQRAGGLFVGENRASGATDPQPISPDPSGSAGDASQALFVRPDGRVAPAQP